MINKLAVVTLLVRDQEEALKFYTEKLGFAKRQDQAFGPGMRWLTVAPQKQTELEITLLQPNPLMHGEAHARELLAMVGKQPTWSYRTDDCRKEYETLSARGVKFVQEPRDEPYGVEAVFEDLYGNTYSLLQPR